MLACVPLDSSIAIKDVAELADVPEAQLTSVLRIMSMVGFFQEPQPQYMAHTALSASFVIRPSQLDMAMFLAETAAPAAYHMAEATKHNKSATGTRQQSAFMAAFDQSQSFPQVCQQRQALYRQWNTYLRYIADDRDDDVIVQLLGSLDWTSMPSTYIVGIAEVRDSHLNEYRVKPQKGESGNTSEQSKIGQWVEGGVKERSDRCSGSV